MRNMNKKSREILVGLFLGANCLNGMVTNMPVVNMLNNCNQSLLSKNAKQTIGQADIYTAAYNQVVDFVDSTFFGHADADANITSGQAELPLIAHLKQTAQRILRMVGWPAVALSGFVPTRMF